MADINQIITLGIGTPGAIKEFLTVGLQISIVTPTVVAAGVLHSGNIAAVDISTGSLVGAILRTGADASADLDPS